MINIEFKHIASWPKLAWVAKFCPQNEDCIVHHGPMVEVSDDWLIEGVWDGEFEAGDFDKTDLVFGSGLRTRGDELVFVSSASGCDRLWYVELSPYIYVSNTLPGLLKLTGLSLKDNYRGYTDDIMTVQRRGIYSYTTEIPSSGPGLKVIYYKNLHLSASSISEKNKIDKTPAFNSFGDYELFLQESAKNIGGNATSESREFKVDMLVGVSSGYDSVATAVISRYSGCNKAATIKNSSSYWRGSDSGESIAQTLGMKCQVVRQDKKKYKHEIATWATTGHGAGRNLTLFDYPKPLTLFFSGKYGDVIWDRFHQELSEPKGDVNAMMCEFRLIEGYFVTVVPWWGIQKGDEIQKINLRDEMKPWTLGTKYDRPIARRLAEEAGIKRGTFAKRKKDTASNVSLRWPYTKSAQKSFQSYLKHLGISPPSIYYVKIMSRLSSFIVFIYMNMPKSLGFLKVWRPWENMTGRCTTFSWANHAVRDVYYKTEKS